MSDDLMSNARPITGAGAVKHVMMMINYHDDDGGEGSGGDDNDDDHHHKPSKTSCVNAAAPRVIAAAGPLRKQLPLNACHL